MKARPDKVNILGVEYSIAYFDKPSEDEIENPPEPEPPPLPVAGEGEVVRYCRTCCLPTIFMKVNGVEECVECGHVVHRVALVRAIKD